MGKIVVFANQKGGVGKTTSTVNLGACLACKGKKILLIDFDPQSNLSSSLGINTDKPGIYELLTKKATYSQTVQLTEIVNLKIISANINLTGATIELVDEERREYYLKDALEQIKNDFDYIFIDCPPSLGILTLNGLVSADFVIIPLQCEYFALEGLSQLLKTIKQVQNQLNPHLQIGGIVFTMYDKRTKLANEVVKEVTSYFGEKVFRTIIPRNIKITEAPSYSKPINLYDPNCIGAISYDKLADEVIKNV